MKRVLLIAPQPFYAERGTPMNVRAMVETLAKIGFEVHLLVLPHGEALSLPGVAIHRCRKIPFVSSVPIGASWKKFAYDFLLLLRASKLAKQFQIDLFHGIEEGAFVAGIVAMRTKKPFIVDMDSCLVTQVQAGRLRWVPGISLLVRALERFFATRAAAIVTVCEDLSEKARKIAPQAPVFQIEDFPLDAAGEINEHLAGRLRSEFGKKKILLYTGNLESYQGIDLLLEAYGLFLERARKAEEQLLLIVGGDETAHARYREKVKKLGIGNSVAFRTGRPAFEMGAYMAIATALVSPRAFGANTPLKLYTYLASGKPVVATRIKAHTQVVDRESAYLADPEKHSFASALHSALYGDEKEREKKTETARQLVKSRFSREAFEGKLKELYGLFTRVDPSDSCPVSESGL